VSDVYGARTIKKRRRRTKAEMEALREALFEIVAENEPATVRGIFYLASSAGVVPKTENEGYRPVQRELLKMRREGLIPWGWITDGSRSRFGYKRYGGLDSYARQVATNYRRDYWHDSEEYVEVWLEKEALRGVISPVTIEEFGLDLSTSPRANPRSATSTMRPRTSSPTVGRPTFTCSPIGIRVVYASSTASRKNSSGSWAALRTFTFDAWRSRPTR
jgi:hypothetical protein